MKQLRAVRNDSKVAKAAKNAYTERVKKYGLRIICMMCSWESRHFPGDGRLRDRNCGQCGLKRIRPVWWTEKYAAKANAERKRVQRASFMID